MSDVTRLRGEVESLTEIIHKLREQHNNLMEHLGVVEDERNVLLTEKELVYEALAGDNAINRYTHEEMIDRIYDIYDTYIKYIEGE